MGIDGGRDGFVVTYAVLATLTGFLCRRVSDTFWNPLPLWGPVVFVVAGGLMGALLPAAGFGLAARICVAAVAAAIGVVRLVRILRAR